MAHFDIKMMDDILQRINDYLRYQNLLVRSLEKFLFVKYVMRIATI